jgi:signal transduction histidine kinase
MAIIMLVMLAVVAASGLLTGLFRTDNFMPHATCYLRDPQVIGLHVTSDLLIGASYLAISIALIYVAYRGSKDIPFHWMFVAFGLFIVTCGMTHLMEVLTVWKPLYWLAGGIKAICAAASVGSAIGMIRHVPKIFALVAAVKVSEERRAKLEEANLELESFVYSVSHDLRSPLRAINGMTSALEEDFGDQLNGNGKDYFERIRGAATRMDGLIQDLLEYSRISRKEFPLEPVPLTAVIHEVEQLLVEEVRQRGAVVEVEVSQELPAVWGNKTLLVEVFANLLSNAIKFVAPGVKPLVRISATHTGGKARVAVTDNGIGIEAADQHKIFRIFERLQSAQAYPGTGIGLAIVQKAIARMSGSIALESAPGIGTSFFVELPVNPPAVGEITSGR